MAGIVLALVRIIIVLSGRYSIIVGSISLIFGVGEASMPSKYLWPQLLKFRLVACMACMLSIGCYFAGGITKAIVCAVVSSMLLRVEAV